MKIKWIKKLRTYLRRRFTPNVYVSTISTKEEIKPHLVSFHGDTYSIFNKDANGKQMKEPEIKLIFRRSKLRNYMDIIIHPDKMRL